MEALTTLIIEKTVLEKAFNVLLKFYIFILVIHDMYKEEFLIFCMGLVRFVLEVSSE